MADRLALAVIPGVGWSANEVQTIAREAEEAGFDAIFAAEVNNDVMATAQLMGAATRRITVGTWIANIYLRHSYACAQGAALIADATGVELASELADGIMPFLWSASRVAKSKAWIDRGRAKASGLGKADVTVGLPTFIGDNVNAMRDVARQNLGLYTTFPFFQRLFRASGFAEEAAQMEKGAGGGALSDRLLDAVCLSGPMARCREQLAAFRAAGTDLPILVPPIGIEGTRAVIKAFRR
jgi:alkanesulfonate monooxygenase SsuD/methylene tetrahydromethanopterin reductase-like flavin-dependent oxidoreductase (luciferase family)